ncbi:MAG: hypothetical protein IT361_05235 [Gemmatimonadaceae bacterium]|nr:hypothetical protein [Gemmatimonadaceae bacterium]
MPRRTAIGTLLGAAASLIMVSACNDQLPNQPIPVTAMPGLLSDAGGAAGTTFRASGRGVIELKDEKGGWKREVYQPWTLAATMGAGGVAALDVGASPALPSAGTAATIQNYLRYLTPIVAVSGDRRAAAFFEGFSRKSIDSAGKVVEIRGVADNSGKPLSEIQVLHDGVLISRVRLTWATEAGGYILVKQVASLHRGRQAEPFAVMTAEIKYSEISPAGMAARAARLLQRYAIAAGLPATAFAQSCARGVLDATLGFAGLIVTAPAAGSNPATAVMWVIGWVKWTEVLYDAVDACDDARQE